MVILAALLHVALLLAAAPSLPGLTDWLAATAAGTPRPPVVQPWRDLRRLSRKLPVLAEDRSVLSAWAPAAIFAASLAGCVLVPGFATGCAGGGDLVLVAGLVGLVRVLSALTALDAGDGPGAVGASRTMTLGMLAEPGLLLAVLLVVALSQASGIDGIVLTLRDTHGMRLGALLAIPGVLAAAMAGRPAPSGFSGRDLALLKWGEALQCLLWVDLAWAFLMPFGMGAAASPLTWPLGLLCWGVRLAAAAGVLGLWPVLRAEMGPSRRIELIAAAALAGLLALTMLFVAEAVA